MGNLPQEGAEMVQARLRKIKIHLFFLWCWRFGHWLGLICPHFCWWRTGGSECDLLRIKCKHSTWCESKNCGSYKRRMSEGIVTVPSPRVFFNKSCLACSLEMRLLPSRNSRNFCGELRVITRRPRVPATAPALKTAIYDKAAKGKGHAESLFKTFIRACPSSDWNRIVVSLTKWKYFGNTTRLPLIKDFKGVWCMRIKSFKSSRIYMHRLSTLKSRQKLWVHTLRFALIIFFGNY